MFIHNKVDKSCRFCQYSLGCSDSSIPDDVPPDECHTCVYKYPLNELGFILLLEDD